MKSKEPEPIQIDREKVRKNINKFIENEGRTYTYISAPNPEVVYRYLYQKELEKGSLGFPISQYTGAKLNQQLQLSTNRSFSQMLHTCLWGLELVSTWECWAIARTMDDSSKGLKFWEKLYQRFFSYRFLKLERRSYEWLQEDVFLKQCDLKNKYAICAFWFIDLYNQNPNNKKAAPLDDFVREEIRRVPKEIIVEKCWRQERDGERWVYEGKVINVDFDHVTLKDIYG